MVTRKPKTEAERVVEIRNESGLHMRPAMQLVECASGFRADISIFKQDLRVDAKSIMQVTMLAATKGTKLRVVASGPDAEEAVAALAEVIESEATPTSSP